MSGFVWHATRLTGMNQLPLSQQTSSPSLIDIGMHGASQVVLLAPPRVTSSSLLPADSVITQ